MAFSSEPHNQSRTVLLLKMSMIYKYLNDKVFHDKHGNPVPKDKRPHKLRIIADNCGGQNKNNKLALALLRLVHLDEFKRI